MLDDQQLKKNQLPMAQGEEELDVEMHKEMLGVIKCAP